MVSTVILGKKASSAPSAMELRRYRGGTWVVALVAGIAIAVGGIVIIVNPFESTVAFVLALGVLLILKGVVDLLISMWFSNATKDFR